MPSEKPQYKARRRTPTEIQAIIKAVDADMRAGKFDSIRKACKAHEISVHAYFMNHPER